MSFFFFKRKTAYEMRISDWSSDVCSSDLHDIEGCVRLGMEDRRKELAISQLHSLFQVSPSTFQALSLLLYLWLGPALPTQDIADLVPILDDRDEISVPLFHEGRSEERRVGKACVSPCRSRWSRYL